MPAGQPPRSRGKQMPGMYGSRAAVLTQVRVNAFPNAKALPLHAGIATGIFARHGIDLELQLTENSRSQRDGLAAGRFDIAQAALDNAVTVIVDAPDTAYALQAKKILLKYGLTEGTDYTIKPVGAVVYRYKALIEDKSNAAGVLNLPFNI